MAVTLTLPPIQPKRPSSPYNQIAINPSLHLLYTLKNTKEAEQVQTQIIKSGLLQNITTSTRLISFFALSSSPNLDHASSIFRQIHEPDTYLYNTMIRAFSNSHSPEIALFFYTQMLHKSIAPSKFTYPFLLKACTQSQTAREGKQVHAHIVKSRLYSDPFVQNGLINMYKASGLLDVASKLFMQIPESSRDFVTWTLMVDGWAKSGRIEIARQLFDEMPERDSIAWNAMISGYVHNNLFVEALDLFRDMQLAKLRPNRETMLTILPAVAHLGGALDQGKWIHGLIDRHGIVVDGALGSALVDMYSKCGDIEMAIEVFYRIVDKGISSWNSIISGLALHGRASGVFHLFYRMEESGFKPNDITFIGLLSACVHGGMVDKGYMYFDLMKEKYGIEPKIEHYGCMVDLLGRAGLLEEAEDLIKEMPIEPSVAIWGALLSSCRTRGSVAIAERAAERILQLDPNHDGSYILLSNIFAAANRWDDVMEVRKKMKDMGIQGVPGSSSIMVNGAPHEFFSGDNSHPQINEISSMLDKMIEELKAVGYIPDISQVLFLMDEEEKETAIHKHSEKLAIAFGLITIRPPTAIHIVKNLRVCGDCHSAIKLISKVYDREIVIRDRKRFHHFKNGSCSCRDYW